MFIQQDLETTIASGQRLRIEVKPSRKIIIARPGSRTRVELHVDSLYRLEPRLTVEGLDANIATYTLAPERSETPFVSRLELSVNPGAVGIHPFKVVALDTLNNGYGAVNLVLVIQPQDIPPEVLDHLRTLLRMYRMYGIQYVIWYLTLHLYRSRGLGFKEIKALYEFLVGRRLSNGTVGDLVKRMERKGIIVKRNGRYYAGVEDEKLVLQAIDAKRVKAGRRGAEQLLEMLSEGRSMREGTVNDEAIPLAVMRVLREAEKLVKQGRTGEALGLIQHTLVGARETGRWILWVKDIFIYYEKKARPPYHYFRSKKLARILEAMGLKQGFIHMEPVQDLIHSLFPGGYREARRIHYLLKTAGWISYGPPLILRIAIYPDGTGGFKLENLNGKTVAIINYDPRKAVKTVKSLVMPGEHVDEYNDNTYFRYR